MNRRRGRRGKRRQIEEYTTTTKQPEAAFKQQQQQQKVDEKEELNRVYEEFIASFSSNDDTRTKGVMTFVRGGVENDNNDDETSKSIHKGVYKMKVMRTFSLSLYIHTHTHTYKNKKNHMYNRDEEKKINKIKMKCYQHEEYLLRMWLQQQHHLLLLLRPPKVEDEGVQHPPQHHVLQNEI